MRRVALAASLILALPAAQGNAVSDAVKRACDSDYAQYCSMHAVGSPGVRTCMREHRKQLTDACIKALAASNEVTKEDIETYKREKAGR